VQAWVWPTALLAWVGTAVVATLDEWHQSFIPSRTGSPRDVLLDSVAGLFFLLLAHIWQRRSAVEKSEVRSQIAEVKSDSRYQ
jgi:VanZ family protein